MIAFPDWRTTCPELDRLRQGLVTIQTEVRQTHGLPGWFDLRQRANDEHAADWCIFPLYLFDKLNIDNVAAMPETCAILEQIPGLRSAAISRLGPGTEIRPHRGPPEVSNFIIRVLFGVEVKGECVIRIDGDERLLREGEPLMFDDLMTHESLNRSGNHRSVLIIDLDRPTPLPLDLVEPDWEQRSASWPRGWEEVGAAGRYLPVPDLRSGLQALR